MRRDKLVELLRLTASALPDAGDDKVIQYCVDVDTAVLDYACDAELKRGSLRPGARGISTGLLKRCRTRSI